MTTFRPSRMRIYRQIWQCATSDGGPQMGGITEPDSPFLFPVESGLWYVFDDSLNSEGIT